jgi:hypothetical protein
MSRELIIALAALIIALLGLALHWPTLKALIEANQATFIVIAAVLTAAATIGLLIVQINTGGS